MDIIEAAREVGRAIQKDPRYVALCTARQHMDEDEPLQKMIATFGEARANLNAEMQSPARDMARIQEMDANIKSMYASIMEMPRMAAFNEARDELQTVIAFVNQIILGSTEGRDPDTIEYAESCGGNCGSCGGCG